ARSWPTDRGGGACDHSRGRSARPLSQEHRAARRGTVSMAGEAETIARCPWSGISDGIYARYHDEEWGVPHADTIRLFAKLVLEGFQSGLSWLTILRKREGFRQAFAGFDPQKIARFGDADFERLMADPGIVRNRAKITATIDNAKAFLALSEKTSL